LTQSVRAGLALRRFGEPPLPIRHGGGFIAAFQNRVVQVRRVNFARVEFHGHTLVGEINNDVEHPGNFHQHRAQLAHACIAILSFGRNLDRLDDCVIGPLRIKRIAWFGLVWACRVHQLWNVRRAVFGCNFARDWFQNAPNIISENSLTGGVRMDVVRLVQ